MEGLGETLTLAGVGRGAVKPPGGYAVRSRAGRRAHTYEWMPSCRGLDESAGYNPALDLVGKRTACPCRRHRRHPALPSASATLLLAFTSPLGPSLRCPQLPRPSPVALAAPSLSGCSRQPYIVIHADVSASASHGKQRRTVHLSSFFNLTISHRAKHIYNELLLSRMKISSITDHDGERTRGLQHMSTSRFSFSSLSLLGHPPPSLRHHC